MKLDDFISETLKAIIKGIKVAQAFANENDAKVNPEIDNKNSFERSKSPVIFFKERDGAIELTSIEFDVAVTVSNQKSAEGGGGVSVFAFKAGGSMNHSGINETVSRIKFNVNVALPSTPSS